MAAQTSAASSGRTKASSGVAKIGPPEPCLPPTARLKPAVSPPRSVRDAGVMETSCVSAPVQFSRQPVMVTLNLRGRLVKALLPRKIRWNARGDGRRLHQLARGEAGGRAADDPPDVVHARLERRQPRGASRSMTAGTVSMVTQRSWTCWRVVMSAMSRPDSRVISARIRAWAAVTMPLGMRMRIMK